MPIDTGSNTSFNPLFPIAGVNQPSKTLRDNFAIIKLAIERLQSAASTPSGIFNVQLNQTFDGQMQLLVGFKNNSFILPVGDPVGAPSLAAIRYNNSTIEYYDGTQWVALLSQSINSISAGLGYTAAPTASPTFTGIPHAPTASAGTNTDQIATTAFVHGEVNSIVNAAPGLLNTLNELATALNNDPDYATHIATQLASKSDISHTHANYLSLITADSGTHTGNNLSILGQNGITTSVSGNTLTIALNSSLAHGNLGGGSLHSLAIANGQAGFMSGDDKAKLDNLVGNGHSFSRFIINNDAGINIRDASTANDAFVFDSEDPIVLTTSGNEIHFAFRPNDTAHGVRAGGQLHSLAIPHGDAGFISGDDKSKLDQLTAALATTTTKGYMSPQDKAKLDQFNPTSSSGYTTFSIGGQTYQIAGNNAIKFAGGNGIGINYNPSSGTMNFILQSVGSLSLSDFTTMAVNYNTSNDRNGNTITPPIVLADGTAVDHTLEVNGSANISFEWTWPGPDSLFNVFDGNGQRVVPAENEIDGFQVIVYQSTSSAVYTLGTSPADEFTTFVQANKRSIILYGVSPNKFYSFFVRAYRHVDADIAANGLIYSATRYSGNVTEHPYQPSSNVAFAGDVTGTIDGVAATTVKQNATAAYGKFSGAGGTLPAGNVEFNFASSTTKGGDALNVVNVGNQPASAVQGAVVNFNTRNDRLATAVANPVIANDGSELAHTLNTDGSTNISFVWSWTGDNSTIDGFIVYVYQSTNATPYVLGQDQNNELVTYVTPDRRALILTGVAVNNYYTFYVQAYRIVDNDVSSSGFIRSSAVKSTYSGSNPYLPASTPVFGGDITGTINGVSAATVQQNASAAYGKFSGTGGTLPAGNVEFNFAASGSKGGSALNTVAVGSQDATTVQNSIINFNTRNDRNSTAVVAPVIANDSSALHYTTNTDGSVNISFVWSWTGAAIDIDFFIVTVYQGNTSAAYTYGTYINDQNVTYVTPEKRAIFLYGVPADKYYTFFVQAGRVVDPDINASGYILSTRVSPTFTGQNPYQPLSNISFQGDVAGTINGVSAATVQTSAQNAWAKFSGVGNTIPAGNVEFNFAASGSKGGSALNTASVGSQTATTVQNSVINFNFRNDRNGNVVVDPAVVTDGTAVDHVVKTNGSVDISFEWTWGGSSTDIDGFIVYTYSTNSNASYTFGTNVQAELVNYVTPEKRAYILLGVSPDSYYTFGVQAYRVVDPDINSAGIIKSNIVKSLRGEENPYQPQTAPVFTGDIIGTINGTSSSTVLSNISTLQNQIATVDSGSAAYSLVRNPLFSDYASTTLPNYWTSTYTSGITRQTGVNSPYLVRTQNDAGQIIYFVQTVGSIGSPSISTNQYIVIEATVRLVAGTFAGSGVLFQTIDSSSNTNNSFLINFLTDADSTNTVVGGGIVGRTYTFTKLVQLAIPNLASFNLYAMGHHPVIGSIAATSTIDWMRVSCRQASAGEILANTATTTVAALTSTVTTFSGSIADLTGRTRAWIDLGVSSGTFAEAFVQLKTESSPGVNTSSIALGAQEIHLYNSGSGTFKRVLSITNGNAEFTGGLSVGTYIRLGNGNYWNVALQSKTFLISDGDVVNFGVDLGNIPTLSFQGNNLAPLSTGQTYNLYADNLSSTGFTARLKIVTPTTPMTYTLTTDAYSGTGPIRQMDKGSNPDSTDGTYHMVINGNISDTPEPIYNYYGGNIP